MSKNKSSVSRSLLNSSMNSESEEVEGNPWAVVPIKTRLYAKDTIEIELSNRKVTKLVCFDQFENLEALWLNNNKLKRIENLDKNFRLKELYLSKNRITTLEGSLSVMKFLTVLLLDNNKLRNLDKQLSLLSKLPFLKNLNLFSNPLAEEPEYRYRVIFNMPKLQILDRHKITDFEKTKAEKIVPEFMNPLSDKANKSKIVNKLNNSQTTNYSSTLLNSTNNSSIANDKVSKQLKLRRPIVHSQKILMSISKSGLKPSKPDPNKHKKAYEKLSITEKEMFIECNQILKRKEAEAKILKEKIEYQLKERELRDFDLPHNKAIEENNKRYLRDDCYDCPELEINEIRRLFNFYDPSKNLT